MAAVGDRRVEQLLHRAFECSEHPMALAEVTPSGFGRLLRVNSGLAALTAYAPDRLAELTVADLAGAEDIDGWLHVLARVGADGGDPRGEGHCRRADGTRLSVELTVTPITDDLGNRTHALIRLHEVSGHPSVDVLHDSGWHDSLTGVLNREGLDHRIRSRVDHRTPEAGRGALLFCDVDDLKEVNDRFGHLAGDAVIRATAHRLVDCVRSQDVVARFGGDEFVVVAWGLAPPAVDSLLRRIDTRVAEPVHFDSKELRVTASIGVAMLDPTTSFEEALGRADAQMYAAKRRRNNRAVAETFPGSAGLTDSS